MAVNNYQITPRHAAENKIKRATISIWLVVVITAINAVVSCIGEAGSFSGLSVFASSYAFMLVSSLFIPIFLPIIITVVILAVFALCALLGKKKPVFNIVAAVLFGADTVFMAYCFLTKIVVSDSTYTVLIGFFFHAWILFDIISGIIAERKLHKMPEEETAPAAPFRENYDLTPDTPAPEKEEPAKTVPEKEPGETPLYAADNDGEIRFNGEYNSVKVTVKRKFGSTELVLNGQVYDKYDRIIEEAYTLSAKADGTTVIYNQSQDGDAELTVNGESAGKIKINL